jgi:hypothetical protein
MEQFCLLGFGTDKSVPASIPLFSSTLQIQKIFGAARDGRIIALFPTVSILPGRRRGMMNQIDTGDTAC